MRICISATRSSSTSQRFASALVPNWPLVIRTIDRTKRCLKRPIEIGLLPCEHRRHFCTIAVTRQVDEGKYAAVKMTVMERYRTLAAITVPEQTQPRR